jgi:RNA polymerase sigma-70 factor (ECF subfamily)
VNPAKTSEVNKIVDHFFRHKAGQLTATLTRIFGPGQLDLAESVVQEALLRACQAWSIKGIPPNPDGWITTVAKNHALDIIRKKKRFHQKEEEIIRWYESLEGDHLEAHDAQEAMDDQLRMMFVCCHPSLSRKSQVALTLKTVGGFSDREIARAFLSNEETTRKLLTRAKQKLRAENISFDLPAPPELPQRLEAVLEVLYLIFNEGYNAHEGDALIRQDFCDEAIRLASLFVHGALSNSPKLPTIKALLALMLLHSSRIPARTDAAGNLVTLAEQDRSRWDQKRVALGLQYLGESAAGEELSVYHLQAHIAACHAVAPSYEEADWPRILTYYDRLLNLSSNPVIALNRAVAISMVNGPEAGLSALQLLADEPLLKNYYLLPAAMADFYRRLNIKPRALEYYQQALALVGTRAEKHYLEKRVRECSQ